MFDNLTDRLGQTLKRLRGQARLSDENIKDTLREVRVALLEADVALPVVRDFIAKVQERAVGQDVVGSLTPGQAFIKLVYDELVDTMGESTQGLKLDTRPPAIILVAGLQGSGKTTTVAKLARWLTEQKKKSVLVTSADIYRPAAIQQLETLANEIGVHFYPSQTNQSPITIARGAIRQAQLQTLDVLIVDTAGRLHVDDEMMAEIKNLHQAISPVETLFVVDSMTGQDAANTARAFNEALDLTGVVLTKVDGDARGGAALSIRHITGKPIKFIGLGEKTTALELFHPDRIASRILGMGDVLSLVEEVERQVDKEQAEKLAKKLKKGKGFDLEDFRLQLQQMNKMGGIANLLDKLPTMNLPANAVDKINDKEFIRLEAIINSMTFQERRQPEIIKGSRKKRISAGSGTQVQDVNRLLKQFTQMQKMMKKMSKGGKLAKLMSSMGSKAASRLPF
ncbi:signal recognition particle protein [Candidatus Nitrosacidococcus sp. I8]|uniref:signal recognition particle protein n=1 Tax=Candidatus Nitrosacidococcus sp. I8 TaxID=2942908 RepID=UPI0022280A2F|nr:signal recognition particle protein [Candidatus Nitrosacidococcus sp. I8]CAH9017752.1 Signal recognition particle protein [Candidatus Nitrosacidococcus sp. I8]